MKTLAGLVLLIILSSTPAWCTTYYVRVGGSDAHACSSTDDNSHAKKTISGALVCLSAGDTLAIHVGTYVEQVIVWPAFINEGTAGNPITIKAFTGESVTVQMPGGGSGNLFDVFDRNYITIQGFILDGNNVANTAVFFNRTDHGDQFGTVDSCELKRALLNGINTGSNHNEISNNTIHDMGRFDATPGYGIYLQLDYNIVEHNEIYNNGGFGIQLYTQIEAAFNIVRANRVHDNGLNISIHDFGDGIYVGNVANNIYNNLVYNHPDAGIRVSCSGPRDNVIYNNTIYNNGQYAIINDTGCGAISGTIVQNNISYSNTSGWFLDTGGTGTINSNNFCQSAATGCSVTGNPGFVNASTGDFHLTLGSGAINQGLTLSAVTTDFAGTSRPQPIGGAYDMGAYEFTNPLPTTTCQTISPATVGTAITPVTMVGNGGSGAPYTFTSGDLPSALVISSGGVISGTPSTAGTFTYHVTVTDVGTNQGSATCTIMINPVTLITGSRIFLRPL